MCDFHAISGQRLSLGVVFSILFLAPALVQGQEADAPTGNAEAAGDELPSSFPPLGSGGGDTAEPADIKHPKSPFGPPPGAKPLSERDPIWVDLRRKAVFVDGRVALRDGPPLEMFACPANTKEHESVVAVNAKPSMVHAGLLLLGAEVGHPVQFDPYRHATGTKVDVLVMWKDEDGRSRKMPAQKWVRSIETKEQLKHPWVFGGSGIWKDEMTGETGYKADSGDFICVSNFETATMDLPISSSAAKGDLLYEAFTENIPPLGTPVRLVLLPRLHEKPLVGEDEKGPQEEVSDEESP